MLLHEARSQAAAFIRGERQRQKQPRGTDSAYVGAGEGWTPDHDAHHTDGELLMAAYAYRYASQGLWPWVGNCKIRDAKDNLIRAGALALAEVNACEARERLNRPFQLRADFPTWGMTDRPDNRGAVSARALAAHDEAVEQLAELLADVHKHDLMMPHDVRLPGVEGCPPNCPALGQARPIQYPERVTRRTDVPVAVPYVCPQCGPDPAGPEKHAETHHTAPRFRDEPQPDADPPRRLRNAEALVKHVTGRDAEITIESDKVTDAGARLHSERLTDIPRSWQQDHPGQPWPQDHCRHPDCPDTNWGGHGRVHTRGAKCPPDPTGRYLKWLPQDADRVCDAPDPESNVKCNLNSGHNRYIDSQGELWDHALFSRAGDLVGTWVEQAPKQPRIFYLQRDEDVTGISGTGRVAEGVVFSDGVVSMRWTSKTPSSVVWYDGIEAVTAVHCHDGKTRIIWKDEQDRVTAAGNAVLLLELADIARSIENAQKHLRRS